MKKNALTAGAVMGALLSSACCWLPLLLVGLGVSAGGVAAIFEMYRVPLLIGTGVMLSAAFYFAYRRPQTRCVVDGDCAEVAPRLQRSSRMMLWLSAAMVVGFATFPSWMGGIVSSGPAEQPSQQVTRVLYQVEGMHCAGCKGLLEAELMKVPGVRSATVSYESRTAMVVMGAGHQPSDDVVAQVGEEIGFTISRSSR